MLGEDVHDLGQLFFPTHGVAQIFERDVRRFERNTTEVVGAEGLRELNVSELRHADVVVGRSRAGGSTRWTLRIRIEVKVVRIRGVRSKDRRSALPDRLKIEIILPSVTGRLGDRTLVGQHADPIAHLFGESILFN